MVCGRCLLRKIFIRNQGIFTYTKCSKKQILFENLKCITFSRVDDKMFFFLFIGSGKEIEPNYFSYLWFHYYTESF